MTDTAQLIQTSLAAAKRASNPQVMLDLIPYSAFIGAQARIENDEVLYWLD